MSFLIVTLYLLTCLRSSLKGQFTHFPLNRNPQSFNSVLDLYRWIFVNLSFEQRSPSDACQRWGTAHLWTLLRNGRSNGTPLLGDRRPSPPGVYYKIHIRSTKYIRHMHYCIQNILSHGRIILIDKEWLWNLQLCCLIRNTLEVLPPVKTIDTACNFINIIIL